MGSIVTADLCDHYPQLVRVADPLFRSFGAKSAFSGQIQTVKVHDDNVLVKESLGRSGKGQVLVVDGGGSLRCALLGDNLAQLALDRGWEGIVIYGCIRDSAAIAGLPIGVKALNTHPSKSSKKGRGEVQVPVNFAGITFFPQWYLYSDEDGILVSEQELIIRS